MELHYRQLGQGYPMIILHGLYGSGDNWLTIAKALSGICEVYLPDLRNHGRSPHDPKHDYATLASDLLQFMQRLDLERAIILGHSMGGKTAMWFATENPGRVSHLIVVDVSPASYHDQPANLGNMQVHQTIMNTIRETDLSNIQSLKEAEERLAGNIPDRSLRQFLMKNLERIPEAGYHWRLNIDALINNLDHLIDGLDMEKIAGQSYRQFPALFIHGDRSSYVGESDKQLIRKLFPLAQILSVKGGSHWLHAEKPDTVIKAVKHFVMS